MSEQLGITIKQARALIDEHIKDPQTRLHLRESEAIMRALARHFGENEDEWGTIGLLHDIDWEETKNDVSQHCVRCIELLKDAGGTDYLIETIVSHAYGTSCGNYKDKQREGKVEHALAAAETLTGLIIACALVQPDKKLASVQPKSLKKKFKNKAFAANCNRDIIMECEGISIPVDDFLTLGLGALQKISNEIGL